MYLDQYLNPEKYKKLSKTMSDRDIARRFNVARSTVENWKKARGLTNERVSH